MKILFITGNYPTSARPANGTFVQQFVWAMARQGNECVVIRPVSFSEKKYGSSPSYYEMEDAGNGYKVDVYRPNYISFSSINLKFTHTGRLTQKAFNYAVFRTVRKLKFEPDIVYGHFLYPGGYAAVEVGKMFQVPSIVRVGEGEFWTIEPFGKRKVLEHYKGVAGIIANGTHLKRSLVNELGFPENKIFVSPNGIDLKNFYPRDKKEVRKLLKLPQGKFLIAFVGPPVEKKGFPALLKAVKEIEDVYLIALGRDMEQITKNEKILFKGMVPHVDVPLWLNAADIFVLPTHIEGSCNSVLEAMACGLPIVTSKGDYMDDIVDDNVAIRVEPTNIKEIQEAILRLKNDAKLRQEMSEAALKKIKEFDINVRAQKIMEWILLIK